MIKTINTIMGIDKKRSWARNSHELTSLQYDFIWPWLKALILVLVMEGNR